MPLTPDTADADTPEVGKRDRGPTLPVLYVSEEQERAIRETLPDPYSQSARAVLLAFAGRMDLVPEALRPWVRERLLELARRLEEGGRGR